MKKLTTKEIQELQFNMLMEITQFCDKNKIRYFLGCGTLCGSIVRGGFFPWDDDIDILMPRDDYERFISKFDTIRLKVLTCENKDYYYPYAKVIDTGTIAYECKQDIPGYGVFVDVFPLDGVPNNIYLWLLKPLKYLMMSKWGCYLDNRNIFVKIVYKLVSIITKPFPNNYFAKILNRICRKYSMKKYSKCGVIVHYRKKNEIVDSEIFNSRIRVLFENYEFYAPRLYDKYLKMLYGDYYEDTGHDNHSHFRAYLKKVD